MIFLRYTNNIDHKVHSLSTQPKIWVVELLKRLSAFLITKYGIARHSKNMAISLIKISLDSLLRRRLIQMFVTEAANMLTLIQQENSKLLIASLMVMKR